MPVKPIDVTIRGKNELKTGFAQATDEIKSFGEKAKDAINKPFEIIKGVVAVEAVRWFGEFAKSSVEAAAAAGAAWGRVETSVINAGISFEGVRGQLENVFGSMEKTTRYSERDTADAFSTLVTISNDYTGSLKNLGLAADIAAKKKIGIADAAEVVGKVMAGETGMLKRYGIVLNGTGSAIDQLREKFNGFAERDSQTLQGRLSQVENGWDKVKEAIGRAIVGDGDNQGMGNFAERLGDLAKWVDNHGPAIQDFFTNIADQLSRASKFVDDVKKGLAADPGPLGDFIRWYQEHAAAASASMQRGIPGRSLVAENRAAKAQRQAEDPYAERAEIAVGHQIDNNAIQARKQAAEVERKKQDEADKKHIEELIKQYDVLEKSAKMTTLQASDYAKIDAIMVELNRFARGTGSAANRATAVDFLSAAELKQAALLKQNEDAADKLTKSGIGVGTLKGERVHTIGDMTTSARATAATLPVTVGSSSSSRLSGVQQSAMELLGGEDAFKHLDDSLGTLKDHLDGFAGGTLVNFFGAWQEGINQIIQAHEKLGVVIPRVMRRAAGAALAADAQDTMLRALKAAALGLTNPVSLLQAGKLFAVGTAELAAAAALSGGGGGSYGGGGVSSSGLSATQSDAQNRGKTTVILQGKGMNFSNPDDLDNLVDALREIGNTGDIEVIVRGGATG